MCDKCRELRVSIARIAQVLEMKPEDIPGKPESFVIENLIEAAKTERGWNNLAAQIAWMVSNILNSPR